MISNETVILMVSTWGKEGYTQLADTLQLYPWKMQEFNVTDSSFQ